MPRRNASAMRQYPYLPGAPTIAQPAGGLEKSIYSGKPMRQMPPHVDQDSDGLLQRMKQDASHRQVLTFDVFVRFDRLRKGSVTTHHFDASLMESGFTWLQKKELEKLHETFQVEGSGVGPSMPGSGQVLACGSDLEPCVGLILA